MSHCPKCGAPATIEPTSTGGHIFVYAPPGYGHEAEIAALRAVLAVAEEMAAYLAHRSEGKVHDMLTRFREAMKQVGK